MNQNPKGHEELIEVSVLLTLRDYLRASYWVLFRRFWWFIIMLVFPYPYMYFTGAPGTLSPTSDPGSWRIFFPGALLLFVLIGTFIAARRNLKSHAALKDEMRYSFSSDGIIAAGSMSSGQMAWAAVRNAYETRHAFLIFIAKNLLYIIPKRCFEDGADVGRLRSLLSEMVGRKARMRKA